MRRITVVLVAIAFNCHSLFADSRTESPCWLFHIKKDGTIVIRFNELLFTRMNFQTKKDGRDDDKLSSSERSFSLGWATLSRSDGFSNDPFRCDLGSPLTLLEETKCLMYC